MNEIIEWDDLSFPERVVLRSKSTKSFLNFTRLWFELIQGDRLLVNWHHRLMASKIDDLIAGRLEPRNLIINIPPGGTKQSSSPFTSRPTSTHWCRKAN
ncbi:Uncharacterised protein [Enterobacter cloacae]|uniref:Uncharacterized protein n=1 Tax=Enterobacter cloacae TaxID=550 RepID=A0A377LWS7_ENTCL|nr:Uncharacterised protein [Enterobacter cloacae]